MLLRRIRGAALGGAFAIVLAIGERNGSIDSLTLPRVRLWGAVSGTVVGLGMAALWALGSPHAHLSLMSLGEVVAEGAVGGTLYARFMLRMLRRPQKELQA